MAQVPVHFEELSSQGTVIPLQRRLAIGRAEEGMPKVTRSSELNHPSLILCTDRLEIEPLTSKRCHLMLEKKEGEYWIRDCSGQDSAACRLNGSPLRKARKLLVNDRLTISSGFHFRFEGDCLVRVPGKAGGTIRSQGLTKVFRGGKYAVNDVSLDIRSNEFVGIVGPSGCGKSTLLKLLCGSLEPTSGTAFLNGVNLHDDPEYAKGVVGYVPQDDIVHAELSVWEATMLAAALRLPPTVPMRERSNLVESTLFQLGLWELRKNQICRLSGGQRKRASLAVELLKETSVFFLDEPTSGLDPATESKLMTQLKDISMQGRTVLCTTHMLELAGMFDRICFIYKGRLIFSGSVDKALEFFDGIPNLRMAYSLIEDPSWRAAKGFEQITSGQIVVSGGVTPSPAANPSITEYEGGTLVKADALDDERMDYLRDCMAGGLSILIDYHGATTNLDEINERILKLWRYSKDKGVRLDVAGAPQEFRDLIDAHRCKGMLALYADRRVALEQMGFGEPVVMVPTSLFDWPWLRPLAAALVLVVVAAVVWFRFGRG